MSTFEKTTIVEGSLDYGPYASDDWSDYLTTRDDNLPIDRRFLPDEAHSPHPFPQGRFEVTVKFTPWEGRT